MIKLRYSVDTHQLGMTVPCRPDSEFTLEPLKPDALTHKEGMAAVMASILLEAITHLTWEEVSPFFDWVFFEGTTKENEHDSPMRYSNVPIELNGIDSDFATFWQLFDIHGVLTPGPADESSTMCIILIELLKDMDKRCSWSAWTKPLTELVIAHMKVRGESND